MAIARACYSQASICLLDDPLSAVDSHVARHIFTRVISTGSGYLAHRTRLLVTNNIDILPEVDLVIVLVGGVITEAGTYDQLLSDEGHFAAYVKEFGEGVIVSKDSNLKEEGKPEAEAKTDDLGPLPRPKETSVNYDVRRNSAGQRPKRPSADDQRKKLIKTEHTETGEVKAGVYLHYFRSLTYFWLAMVFLGYIGIQLSSVGASIWLAIWSNDAEDAAEAGKEQSKEANQMILSGIMDFETMNTGSNDTLSLAHNVTQADIYQRNSRLAIFGLFGLFQGAFVLFAAVAKEKAIVRSSIVLHRSLLESIMKSPMNFFDQTPLGRIVK